MVNFVNILVTIVVTLAKWMNFWKNKGGHFKQPTTRLALRQYVVDFLHFRVKLQQFCDNCADFGIMDEFLEKQRGTFNTTPLVLRQNVVNLLYFCIKLQQLFLDCKYHPPHTHTHTHTEMSVGQSVSQSVG